MLLPPKEYLEKLQNYLYEAANINKIDYKTIYCFYNKLYSFCVSKNLDNDDVDHLVPCLIHYIQCIANYLVYTKQPSTHIETALIKFVTIIAEICHQTTRKDRYMKLITIPLIERITTFDTNPWFSKQILKNLIIVLKNAEKKLRCDIAEDNINFFCKLIDILCSCGDIYYQILILEVLFEMYSVQQIGINANIVFPESKILENGLRQITIPNFHNDARTFLTLVNSQFSSIFSIKCLYVALGNINLVMLKSANGYLSDLWIDFNLQSESISILCDNNCLTENQISEESQDDNCLELLTFYVADIDTVVINDLFLVDYPTSQGAIVLFKLNKFCSVQNASSQKATQNKTLKVVISTCPELEILKTKILPQFIGNKVISKFASSKTTNRASVLPQTGGVLAKSKLYKPLPIRVYSKSCKSNNFAHSYASSKNDNCKNDKTRNIENIFKTNKRDKIVACDSDLTTQNKFSDYFKESTKLHNRNSTSQNRIINHMVILKSTGIFNNNITDKNCTNAQKTKVVITKTLETTEQDLKPKVDSTESGILKTINDAVSQKSLVENVDPTIGESIVDITLATNEKSKTDIDTDKVKHNQISNGKPIAILTKCDANVDFNLHTKIKNSADLLSITSDNMNTNVLGDDVIKHTSPFLCLETQIINIDSEKLKQTYHTSKIPDNVKMNKKGTKSKLHNKNNGAGNKQKIILPKDKKKKIKKISTRVINSGNDKLIHSTNKSNNCEKSILSNNSNESEPADNKLIKFENKELVSNSERNTFADIQSIDPTIAELPNENQNISEAKLNANQSIRLESIIINKSTSDDTVPLETNCNLSDNLLKPLNNNDILHSENNEVQFTDRNKAIDANSASHFNYQISDIDLETQSFTSTSALNNSEIQLFNKASCKQIAVVAEIHNTPDQSIKSKKTLNIDKDSELNNNNNTSNKDVKVNNTQTIKNTKLDAPLVTKRRLSNIYDITVDNISKPNKRNKPNTKVEFDAIISEIQVHNYSNDINKRSNRNDVDLPLIKSKFEKIKKFVKNVKIANVNDTLMVQKNNSKVLSSNHAITNSDHINLQENAFDIFNTEQVDSTKSKESRIDKKDKSKRITDLNDVNIPDEDIFNTIQVNIPKPYVRKLHSANETLMNPEESDFVSSNTISVKTSTPILKQKPINKSILHKKTSSKPPNNQAIMKNNNSSKINILQDVALNSRSDFRQNIRKTTNKSDNKEHLFDEDNNVDTCINNESVKTSKLVLSKSFEDLMECLHETINQEEILLEKRKSYKNKRNTKSKNSIIKKENIKILSNSISKEKKKRTQKNAHKTIERLKSSPLPDLWVESENSKKPDIDLFNENLEQNQQNKNELNDTKMVDLEMYPFSNENQSNEINKNNLKDKILESNRIIIKQHLHKTIENFASALNFALKQLQLNEVNPTFYEDMKEYYNTTLVYQEKSK